jgi:hypothetical protein
MTRKIFIGICKCGAVICFISLLPNFGYGFYLGGSASIGGIQDGHYYVQSHSHRREVSREQFERSILFERITMFTMPFAVIVGIMAFVEQKKRGVDQQLKSPEPAAAGH